MKQKFDGKHLRAAVVLIDSTWNLNTEKFSKSLLTRATPVHDGGKFKSCKHYAWSFFARTFISHTSPPL